MKIAYRLKDNAKHIAQVQKATLTTDNFGIELTDGLFGSAEWWNRIASGELSVHTLRGTITERFMGSMGDWPEIRVCSETGEKSSWTREVNNREQDALYRMVVALRLTTFSSDIGKNPRFPIPNTRLFLKFEWSQTRKEMFRVHTRGCLLRKSRIAFLQPQFWLCLRLHMSLPNWVAHPE